MASTNWRLYPVDFAHGLTISPLRVTSSSGAATAPDAVDGQQTTLWIPGTTGNNIRFGMDFGAAKLIEATALGNIQGADGVCTMSVYVGTSLLAIDGGIVGSANTIPSGIEDWVLVHATDTSARYLTLDFDSVPANFAVGTISALGNLEMIVLGSSQSPRFALGESMSVANDPIEIAGGGESVVIREGVRGTLTMELRNLDATITGTYQRILDSYRSTNGWAKGIWVTREDHEAGSLAARGFYGRPAGGLQASIYGAGPVGTVTITLVEIPKGIQ